MCNAAYCQDETYSSVCGTRRSAMVSLVNVWGIPGIAYTRTHTCTVISFALAGMKIRPSISRDTARKFNWDIWERREGNKFLSSQVIFRFGLFRRGKEFIFVFVGESDWGIIKNILIIRLAEHFIHSWFHWYTQILERFRFLAVFPIEEEKR